AFIVRVALVLRTASAPEFAPLSLHGALPISDLDRIFGGLLTWLSGQTVTVGRTAPGSSVEITLGWSDTPESRVEDTTAGEGQPRSEEHTSELQSRENLVCRLLLEKKKHFQTK